MTTRRMPAGTEVLGRFALVAVTTRLSASEAHRPSWWFIQTPGPTAAHSVSAVQERQVLVVVLQMGVAPEQSVLLPHCTQPPVCTEQMGNSPLFLAAHWLLAVHPEQV
jgi:hypothetical protein